MADETSWHLDKKVPIAFIFTIILQTAGVSYFISGLSFEVSEAINHNTTQDNRLDALTTTTQSQAVLTATVTQQIAGLKDTLEQVREDQKETNSLLRQSLGKQP